MVEELEKNFCLELRFLIDKIGGCLVDVNRFMRRMGLSEGIHYSVKNIEIGDESLRNFLDYSGGVLLQINPRNSLYLREGVIGGYDRIIDFLREHEREIKDIVEYSEKNGDKKIRS